MLSLIWIVCNIQVHPSVLLWNMCSLQGARYLLFCDGESFSAHGHTPIANIPLSNSVDVPLNINLEWNSLNVIRYIKSTIQKIEDHQWNSKPNIYFLTMKLKLGRSTWLLTRSVLSTTYFFTNTIIDFTIL